MVWRRNSYNSVPVYVLTSGCALHLTAFARRWPHRLTNFSTEPYYVWLGMRRMALPQDAAPSVACPVSGRSSATQCLSRCHRNTGLAHNLLPPFVGHASLQDLVDQVGRVAMAIVQEHKEMSNVCTDMCNALISRIPNGSARRANVELRTKCPTTKMARR